MTPDRETREQWRADADAFESPMRDRRILTLLDALDADEAKLARVREAVAEHWDYQIRREAKFGRSGSSCVCGECRVMRALDGRADS